jgi:hypothetical protein
MLDPNSDEFKGLLAAWIQAIKTWCREYTCYFDPREIRAYPSGTVALINPNWVPIRANATGIGILIALISAWITDVRARRRMRRAFGRKVTDTEVSSLNAWMKVDELEQQAPKKPE